MPVIEAVATPTSDSELKISIRLGKTLERLIPVGSLTMSVREFYLFRSVLMAAAVHNENVTAICPHLEEILSGKKVEN